MSERGVGCPPNDTTKAGGGAFRMLVFGYGNPGRQDDGLGPAAAEAIERMGWPGVTVCDNYQLAIEDAVDVAQHDLVWFVDAARTGPEPFALRRLWPAHDIAFTSHLVKPEVLLSIAGHYYGNSPEAHLLGIRGYEFEFLEGITDRASDNLRQAVAMIRDRIRSLVGLLR